MVSWVEIPPCLLSPLFFSIRTRKGVDGYARFGTLSRGFFLPRLFPNYVSGNLILFSFQIRLKIG